MKIGVVNINNSSQTNPKTNTPKNINPLDSLSLAGGYL